MATTLISWLGRTDLRAVDEAEQVGVGPVAQAVQTGRFARLELLCDYPPGDAERYLAWLQTQAPTPVAPHYLTLASPTDFGAIYRHARAVVAQTNAGLPPGDGLAFHLSPGTPHDRRLDARPDHRPGGCLRRPAVELETRPCERARPGAAYRPSD